MPLSLPELEHIFYYLEQVTAAALLVRLWRAQLLTQYKFFALFLAALIAEFGVTLVVHRGTDMYFWAFVGSESILLFLQILIIVELFSIVLRSYPGIASSGRKFIWLAFSLAILLSAWFAALHPESRPGMFPVLAQYLLISRVVAFTLLFFLALLLAFLFWFPIQLSRNVLVYAGGYCVYFASRAITRFAENLFGPQQIHLFSTISIIVVVGCLVIWLVLLSARGEQQDVTIGHRWSPAEGQLLVRQLESINATLLKAGRK